MAKGNHRENRQRNQGQNPQYRRRKSAEIPLHQRVQLRLSLQRQAQGGQLFQQTHDLSCREDKLLSRASVYASAISLLLSDVEEVLGMLSREEDSLSSTYTVQAILSLLRAAQALSLLQKELLPSGSRSRKQTFSKSNQTKEDLR